MPRDLAPRRVWVFDLDNTLYPPEVRLFDQIEARMTAFVADALGLPHAEADRLRRQYWHAYGTTLAGLMHEHGIAPERYLVEVHDISFDALTADPDLRTAIDNLPGRRVIYTNGSAEYAERVIAARGLAGLFDAVYGVEHADYHPKPARHAFETVFGRDGLDPRAAVMFEDDARNLAVPHALGMGTVHVAPEPEDVDHIHYHTDDLTGFLRDLGRYLE